MYIKYLESELFEIDICDKKFKVEFKMSELLNDMEMLAFLAGELSNAATYFSKFANVKKSDANDYKKTFGYGQGNHWKPFLYEKRARDSAKVVGKRNLLEKKTISKANCHKQLTHFIAIELQSRQMQVPLVEHYIDVAKCEPLRLKNNVIKERFMVFFK